MQSPVSYNYNTGKKDQEEGLNAAVAYGISHSWQLISIIWEKEDDEGNHVFNITYLG